MRVMDLKDGNKSFYVVVNNDMVINEEITIFLDYLENIKNYSPNTIEGYARDLRYFAEWLEEKQLKFYEVKPRHIPSYMQFLDKRIKPRGNAAEPAAITINGILAAVSSLFKYYSIVGGFVEESPLVKVEGVRPSNMGKGFLHHVIDKSKVDVMYFKRKVPDTSPDRKRLWPDQIDTLLEACQPKDNNPRSFREHLIFKFLYETGMRVGELLGRRITDYSEPSPLDLVGEITIKARPDDYKSQRSKTGDRIVHVDMSLIEEIDKYVLEFRPHTRKNYDHIFLADHSNPKFHGNPISYSAIKDFFKELSQKTGIYVTPHRLRHTHSSELHDCGYDSLFIAKRLGNSIPEKYTQPSSKAMREAYERYIKATRDKNITSD